MRKRIVNLALSLLLPSSITPASPEATDSYTDAETYLATTSDSPDFAPAALQSATAALAAQFAAACGDTFCAGDYANLQPLSWTCAVRKSDGVLGQCLWIFAGSAATINRADGTLTPIARTFACTVPISGTAHDLVSFLNQAQESGDSGYDGLTRTKLPGSGHSLREVLISCLGG
ncbi:MAG: hypothetical protein FJ146_06255 [Deltaproteobacteria bacterium]|nr:hypothetical protein [Deltaproteobacteria bacterium]